MGFLCIANLIEGYEWIFLLGIPAWMVNNGDTIVIGCVSFEILEIDTLFLYLIMCRDTRHAVDNTYACALQTHELILSIVILKL